MQETVTLSDGRKFVKTASEPKVSNVVTVTYLKDKIINPEFVFKYVPVKYVPEANGKKFHKSIPTFGYIDEILSSRHGDKGFGLRYSKKQMENICSMDVSIRMDADLGTQKCVHCKISPNKLHVTGAKSFEQGDRATQIIIRKIEATQRLIDNFRLKKNASNDIFYELYNGIRTKEEVDELCKEMLENSEMICSRKISIDKSTTANGVYEVKVNFNIILKTLCEIAVNKYKFSTDHANWHKSTTASISIPHIEDNNVVYYHRAQVNSGGSIRLSSPCLKSISYQEGYRKLIELIFKVWDRTREIFEERLNKVKELEKFRRAEIEEEYHRHEEILNSTSMKEMCEETSDIEIARKMYSFYNYIMIKTD